MREIDKALKAYFRNPIRFADLFNGIFFCGRDVIKAKDLLCASESYVDIVTQSETITGETEERFRDVKMCMMNGVELRLLALENQEEVNYLMPFRCMQYDTMEYSKQVDEIGTRNGKKGRFKKTDSLTPIYTLCVYYGEKTWDGPRSLKDMMNFGGDRDEMSHFFADYPMRLFCLNERDNFDEFSSELGLVFDIVSKRGSLQKLEDKMKQAKGKLRMGLDAFRVTTMLMGQKEMWENREKYLTEDKEEYDMCQAILELKERERTEGENLVCLLVQKMIAGGKGHLIEKMTNDVNFRHQMMKEYGLL